MKSKITLLFILFAGIISFLLLNSKTKKIAISDLSTGLYLTPTANKIVTFSKFETPKNRSNDFSNTYNKEDMSWNKIEAEIKKIEEEINRNDFIIKSNKNELSHEEASHFRLLLAKRDQVFALKVSLLLEEL